MDKGWKGMLVYLAEWISRLAYLNLLWIGFTLLGLGVFGFMPATVSMFAITRQWMRQPNDTPLFRSFWNYYKQEFLKSNATGVILFLIGHVMYFDVFIFEYDESMSMQMLKFVLYILALMYILFVVYFFPVYVQFDMKWYQYFKISALMPFATPLRALLMTFLGYGVFYLMSKMPILMFFFLGSSISYLWQMIALPAFYQFKTQNER